MSAAYSVADLPAQMQKRVRVDESGCWLWQGAQNGNGYAQVQLTGQRFLVHRVSYVWLVGQPIPEGLQLDHLCRVRHCLNPDHLEPVTPSVNSLRADLANRRRTHCPSGHEYTPDNVKLVRFATTTRRYCRACRRTREAERYRRVKAAKQPA